MSRSATTQHARITDAVAYFTPIVLEGRYDDLTDRHAHPHAAQQLRYSDIAQRHADALSHWLAGASLPATAVWSLGPGRTPAPEVSYSRFALAFELDAMRPGLLSVSPASRAANVCHVDDEALAEFTRRAPGVSEHDRTHLSHLVLCAIWRAVAPYRIFETDNETLAHIDGELRRIEGDMQRLQQRWMERSRRSRVPPLTGVRALLAFQRGRVLRAIGGSAIPDAEVKFLTAHRIYQERVSTRVSKREPLGAKPQEYAAAVARDLRFSACRAAQAMLQLAYMDVLRANCSTAELHLHSAAMLALNTSDHVLLTEIRLVSLTARRLQLRSPRDNADAIADLDEIRAELQDIEQVETARKRPEYARMAQYQHLLCELYRRKSTSVMNTVQVLKRARTLAPDARVVRALGSNPFWTVSRLLLEARTLVTAARWSRSVDLLAQASQRVEEAQALIGSSNTTTATHHPHLENLGTDCRICAAWIAVEEQDFTKANTILDALPSAPASDGYTTFPASAAFIALLRIAVELGQLRWSVAEQRLATFAREHLPALEVGWLLDLHQDLVDAEAGQRIIHGSTPDEIAAEYARVLRGEQGRTEERRFSLPVMHDRLAHWLYPIAERVLDAHYGSSGEAATVEELELLWDVARSEVNRLRDEQVIPTRKHGSRRRRG